MVFSFLYKCSFGPVSLLHWSDVCFLKSVSSLLLFPSTPSPVVRVLGGCGLARPSSSRDFLIRRSMVEMCCTWALTNPGARGWSSWRFWSADRPGGPSLWLRGLFLEPGMCRDLFPCSEAFCLQSLPVESVLVWLLNLALALPLGGFALTAGGGAKSRTPTGGSRSLVKSRLKSISEKNWLADCWLPLPTLWAELPCSLDPASWLLCGSEHTDPARLVLASSTCELETSWCSVGLSQSSFKELLGDSGDGVRPRGSLSRLRLVLFLFSLFCWWCWCVVTSCACLLAQTFSCCLAFRALSLSCLLLALLEQFKQATTMFQFDLSQR